MLVHLREAKRWLAMALMLALGGMAAVGCGDDSSDSDGNSAQAKGDKEVRLAYFVAASQNDFFAAITKGIEAHAKANNASVDVFDAAFDPQKQFGQIQDAITSQKYDAFVISAVDGPGLKPAVTQAADAGIPVVQNGIAIGPDDETEDPQEKGVVGSVMNPPAAVAGEHARLIVDACKGVDPCEVAYLLGSKTYSPTVAQRKALAEELTKTPNAKLVAEGYGGYLAGPSLKATQDILQAHPNLDVIASAGDQMIVGAERALKAAGKTDITLIGTGANKDAVEGINRGTWYASVIYLPISGGETSAKMAIDAARGKKIADPGIWEGKDLSQIGPVLSKSNVDGFRPQW